MKAQTKRIPLLERYNRFLPEDRPVNSCWEWQGARAGKGYGLINEGGANSKKIYAHRLAWEVHNSRPVPKGLHVCHHCDNPACVNPNHLFLGTNQDNVNDKVSKGRQPRGSKSQVSKLSDDDVMEIRKLGSLGKSHTSIAKKFNVQRSNITLILHGKRWTHLPVAPVKKSPPPRGSSHGMSKLTSDQVINIRDASAKGESYVSIARRFQISSTNVSHIVRRKIWKHL